MTSHKSKEVVIEIQGLIGPEEVFIPNEVAVLSVEGNHCGHWFIAPPCEFNDIPFTARRQNHWLTANYHRLDWEYGTTPYKVLHKILKEATRNVARIYVRGREKVLYLQSILCRTIINLENYSPAFKRLPENHRYCLFHAEANLHGNYPCALHNAAKLRVWIRFNVYTKKVPIKEIDINKVWNTDAYRISQVTSHELSSDESTSDSDNEEEEGAAGDEDSNTTATTSNTILVPPAVPVRVPRGEDVCGPGDLTGKVVTIV